MTAQEYLLQVYKTDMQISAMMEEIAHLRSLAEKVTSTIGGAPGGGAAKREDFILRCIIRENELGQISMKLLDLRQEVFEVITKVRRVDLRLVLIKRYLHYKKWEDIAHELNYGIDNIFHLHRKALKVIAPLLKKKQQKAETLQ